MNYKKHIKTILSDILYQIKDDYIFFSYYYKIGNYYHKTKAIGLFIYSIPYRIYKETIRVRDDTNEL